jgi:hypothetical protein
MSLEFFATLVATRGLTLEASVPGREEEELEELEPEDTKPCVLIEHRSS